MKLVHELYVRAQVGGGVLRPYAQRVGTKALPVSGYIDELLIVCPKTALYEEEVVRIDGDLRVVMEALETALAVIECSAEDAVEQGKLDPKWRSHPPRDGRTAKRRRTRRSRR